MTAPQLTGQTYASYLALDEVLAAQRPLTDQHDEMMFILVHQAHELCFKELLCEATKLQRDLSVGNSVAVLRGLERLRAGVRSVISQIDVIDTLQPRRFAMFRKALGTSSGFESLQYREFEAMLGRRDRRLVMLFPKGSAERGRMENAVARPSIMDSVVAYLAAVGYRVPEQLLTRDPAARWEPSPALQAVLRGVEDDDGVPAFVCEQLLNFDQLVQEWRFRHVQLVDRVIGAQPGTGGTSGSAYLRTTVFVPIFPDLWAIRGTYE